MDCAGSGWRGCQKPEFRPAKSRPYLSWYQHRNAIRLKGWRAQLVPAGAFGCRRQRSRSHCDRSPEFKAYLCFSLESRESANWRYLSLTRRREYLGSSSWHAWQVGPCHGDLPIRFESSGRWGFARRVPEQEWRQWLGTDCPSEPGRDTK